MMQLIFRGLEHLFGFDSADQIIFDPKRVINHYEKKGYQFLSDWNSGKLLIRKPEDEPYIPERICLPSGRILDETELLAELVSSKVGSKKRGELEDAFYYYNALLHEDMGTKRHDYASSFLDEEDEQRTTEKYSKNPFYLDHAA